MKKALMLSLAGAILSLTTPLPILADQANLLQQTVLVATVDESENDIIPTVASYASSGDWAITSPTYIDATIAVFDLSGTESLASASLQLPLAEIFSQGGRADLRIFAFASEGPVSLFDFSAGSRIPVAELDARSVSAGDSNATLSIDVTGAANAVLMSSPYVAFRVMSALQPAEVSEGFPAFRGVRFAGDFSLEYTPGTPPVSSDPGVGFDGFHVALPGLSAPGVGAYDVVLRIVDHDSMTFALHSAVDITTPGLLDGSGFSGAQLLDCNAFSAPPGSQALLPGAPVFSPLSGLLDVPRLRYDGREYHARLQLISDGDPMLFTLLSAEPRQDSESTAQAISEIGGSLTIEPTLDFLPLCHGWVLIGDTSRNELVERNVITGATGRVYPFNTTPDQMLLDPETARVYLTTEPSTERLYRLDLGSGQISHYLLREGGRHLIPRALSLGENNNIFALFFDPYYDFEDPTGPAEHGLWMGIMNAQGQLLRPNIPLLLPNRILYEPSRRHVVIATDSNLASFTFNPSTLALDFVPQTDVPVGSGCTDLSISPNGYRTAYSCPAGNGPVPRTTIIDMNPSDYYDADGEWYLDSPPITATFSPDGETLIAADASKLYFFNVFNHLLRESYDLDLQEGEQVKKLRVSRDGRLIMILMQSELGAASSRIYWLAMPTFQ